MSDQQDRGHSYFGGSNSHRYMGCYGSHYATKDLKDISSIHAKEGTAAHELCERCYKEKKHPKKYLGTTIMVEGINFEVTQEMVDAVVVWLDTLKHYTNKGDTVVIEPRLDLSAIAPEGADVGGYADAVIYQKKRRRLIVLDFKYGKGVGVEVVENKQAMFYGLGALLTFADWRVDSVVLVIVQPRYNHKDGFVRDWECETLHLIEFGADLSEAIEAAMEPDAPRTAGSWCQFCGAAGNCEAQRASALAAAQAEFTDEGELALPNPENLSGEELANALAHAGQIEQWVKDLRSYAFDEAMEGRCAPGFKLVRKRATRKWTNTQEAIQRLRDAGLKSDDIYKPTDVKTPAQIEKVLAALDEDRDLVADLVISESSGLTLAPESDKRQAARPDAADEFTDAS